MKKIRSFIVTLMFGIFGAGSILLNFLVFPPLKLFFHGDKLARINSDVIRMSWKFFIFLNTITGLIKVDIKKLEKIENKVIVSTHPSFIDIVVLVSLIPYSTCFVKKELAHNPILKNLISSIFITNEVELEELKSQSKKMLDMGFNVIIFPSGIRHRRNEFPKIKKGASLVALNAGKNIVPIRMFTDGDFIFINQPFYEVDEKTVTFELEQCAEIDIQQFANLSEIKAKKQITDMITKSLYGAQ